MLQVAVLLLFCRYGAATYSIFIPQSELERYYLGTDVEVTIQGVLNMVKQFIFSYFC